MTATDIKLDGECSGSSGEASRARTLVGAGTASPPTSDDQSTELYDLRVVVERIEGRSVCGLVPGDFIELTESSRLRIPQGRHFCLYALAACLPLLPAKQRPLPAGDWLAQDSHVACPDPDERVILRIERTGRRQMPTVDLT